MNFLRQMCFMSNVAMVALEKQHVNCIHSWCSKGEGIKSVRSTMWVQRTRLLSMNLSEKGTLGVAESLFSNSSSVAMNILV